MTYAIWVCDRTDLPDPIPSRYWRSIARYPSAGNGLLRKYAMAVSQHRRVQIVSSTGAVYQFKDGQLEKTGLV